jgi:acyl transferase domain-containing protein
MSSTGQWGSDAGGIAIVGMSGRFPGANDVNQFWRNVRDGIESIAAIDDEEWGRAIKAHPAFLADPSLVRARPKLDGVDLFDASFFGLTPRAAQILDPQQRLFLECAWEAFESAGYDTERLSGSVAVYAGVTPSTYLMNLLQHSAVVAKVGWLDADLSNRCDSLATRVAYKLNLKGPTFTVQSYCSTSLVAIHLAARSLLAGECDLALAGGVTITVPQEAGYAYLEGSILSPDGRTRTFDAKANGMVFGNGVGIVLLKRLADALVDGDTIWGVIRGSATNNDGSLKVGFTAPSVSGQSEVIADALQVAGVNPETVTYVEAHGTATPLGDPAEVAALTKAFRRWTNERRFCAIGSVKTNVGHLDAAAGVTGVIKTALSLTHRQIPPSLNFETPNPQIDFESSPFYVNTTLQDWRTDRTPRRAGVSAYGIGGTNAHVILEEAAAERPGACVAGAAALRAHVRVARSRDGKSRTIPARTSGRQPRRCGVHAAGRPSRLRSPPGRRMPGRPGRNRCARRRTTAGHVARRTAQSLDCLHVHGAGRAVRADGPRSLRIGAGVPRGR